MDSLFTDQQARLKDRLEAANIHPKSFLATDYLNNFNEVIMILEMLADMPDILDDARSWQHKSYVEHFEDSGFMEKSLVIEAYQCAPHCYRQPFDSLVDKLHAMIGKTIAEVTVVIGNEQETRRCLDRPLSDIKATLSALNAIIHGVVSDSGNHLEIAKGGKTGAKENQARIDSHFDQISPAESPL